jgi:hypothetical protein
VHLHVHRYNVLHRHNVYRINNLTFYNEFIMSHNSLNSKKCLLDAKERWPCMIIFLLIAADW